MNRFFPILCSLGFFLALFLAACEDSTSKPPPEEPYSSSGAYVPLSSAANDGSVKVENFNVSVIGSNVTISANIETVASSGNPPPLERVIVRLNGKIISEASAGLGDFYRVNVSHVITDACQENNRVYIEAWLDGSLKLQPYEDFTRSCPTSSASAEPSSSSVPTSNRTLQQVILTGPANDGSARLYNYVSGGNYRGIKLGSSVTPTSETGEADFYFGREQTNLGTELMLFAGSVAKITVDFEGGSISSHPSDTPPQTTLSASKFTFSPNRLSNSTEYLDNYYYVVCTSGSENWDSGNCYLILMGTKSGSASNGNYYVDVKVWK